jgi:hypothetical protein
MVPRLRKPSLPVRLALLVAGTTLPLIVFAGATIYRNYETDRAEAAARVLETARGIRTVLDAELQRITGSLRVLSFQLASPWRFRRLPAQRIGISRAIPAGRRHPDRRS